MRSSELQHDAAPVGRLLYWIGRVWLFFSRWKVVGDVPPGRKFVVIAAPHTSNWDLPHMLAAAFIFRIRIHWLGKKSLFWGPFGPIMRWLGGIPIDRSAHHGVVRQVADHFENAEALTIAVPPAGTRGRGKHWKSGFYWIAKNAQVPILCGFLDYEKKESGLGLTFIPSSNLDHDMERIRSYYDGIVGKYPQNKTPIRLREESAAA